LPASNNNVASRVSRSDLLVMGFSQYFWAVPSSKVRGIQTASTLAMMHVEYSDLEELCSWRRHYGLDAWMQKLFVQKGGVLPDDRYELVFGYVRLLDEDLTMLDADIRSGKVGDTKMLFDNDFTLGFCIPAARKAITAGKAVFYSGG
jgi:hypothetical protein